MLGLYGFIINIVPMNIFHIYRIFFNILQKICMLITPIYIDLDVQILVKRSVYPSLNKMYGQHVQINICFIYLQNSFESSLLVAYESIEGLDITC